MALLKDTKKLFNERKLVHLPINKEILIQNRIQGFLYGNYKIEITCPKNFYNNDVFISLLDLEDYYYTTNKIISYEDSLKFSKQRNLLTEDIHIFFINENLKEIRKYQEITLENIDKFICIFIDKD